MRKLLLIPCSSMLDRIVMSGTPCCWPLRWCWSSSGQVDADPLDEMVTGWWKWTPIFLLPILDYHLKYWSVSFVFMVHFCCIKRILDLDIITCMLRRIVEWKTWDLVQMTCTSAFVGRGTERVSSQTVRSRKKKKKIVKDEDKLSQTSRWTKVEQEKDMKRRREEGKDETDEFDGSIKPRDRKRREVSELPVRNWSDS